MRTLVVGIRQDLCSRHGDSARCRHRQSDRVLFFVSVGCVLRRLCCVGRRGFARRAVSRFRFDIFQGRIFFWSDTRRYLFDFFRNLGLRNCVLGDCIFINHRIRSLKTGFRRGRLARQTHAFFRRMAQHVFRQSFNTGVEPSTITHTVHKSTQHEQNSCQGENNERGFGSPQNSTGQQGQHRQGRNIQQAPGPYGKSQQGQPGRAKTQPPLRQLPHGDPPKGGDGIIQSIRKRHFQTPAIKPRHTGDQFRKDIERRNTGHHRAIDFRQEGMERRPYGQSCDQNQGHN